MADYSSLGISRSVAYNPDVDVSQIKGNISDEEKQLAVKVFSHFVSTKDKSYGAGVGQRLKMVETNVWGKGEPTSYGETIFEIDVRKDMCNIFGTLHGACAAYMIDPCSVSSLVVLGLAMGVDGTGVSQAMNLIWHQPARVGAKLRIVSISMFIHGRVRSARCEIWNGEHLCVSAVHSTVNPWYLFLYLT
ncbi:hypothetical protein Hypma_013013 [Hypsizygus marmoreus]|uniref:Thioesterase domain-containing protein n=1 Tax=Hypsizygus marmoreus TaxID=39966 RepID=A0A369JCM7_HYPMA|nr:hypothetical protein Hypma_013013 [Hypsizygus marmoreus]